MSRRSEASSKEPTQRQLRVGEEIRHALSHVLMRDEAHISDLDGVSVTISVVKIGPDLKNATAYFTTLGGASDESALKTLNKFAPILRKLMGKRIHMRHIPKLYFKLDKSFELAGRVNAILNKPEVQRDLQAADESEEE